jgi:hypothetical protein
MDIPRGTSSRGMKDMGGECEKAPPCLDMGLIVPSRRVIIGASEVNMVICSATLASQAWRLLIIVSKRRYVSPLVSVTRSGT